MNYIKPDDIKAYVEQHPEGIAGMSEELTAMVNHFAELIVRECQERVEHYIRDCGEINSLPDTVILKHFGVEE